MGGVPAGARPDPYGLVAAVLVRRPAHAALFDRSGNIGPTVWSDGRIVGGWAQRATGEVVYRLFEDVGIEKADAIAAAAARTAEWIGDVRVTPRFALRWSESSVPERS